MKKFLLCVALVSWGFTSPLSTILKEGAEQSGKVLKQFGDDAVLMGQRIYKSLGTNAVEKKFLKSAKFSKTAGNIVAKRNHIFRPTAENLSRMKQGNAPQGIDGKSLELHHLKQDKDGIIIEMTFTEHKVKYNKDLHRCRGGMNCSTNVEHDSAWDSLKRQHWKARAKEFDKAS